MLGSRILPLLGFTTACWFLALSPASAAAPDIGHQDPKEIAESWGRIIGFALAGLSALLILYVLLFRRRRLEEATSRLMLFFGICVIPVPLSLLSTAVGMERSKRVEFCSSCHVMDPFVDDMRALESESLAAVHFKNRYIQREQCYACHTNYGIFGTIEAKKAGLRHIWKEATESYELPVKISKPYDWTICLGCHGESKKFLDQEAHQDSLPDILKSDGDTTCLDCHDAPHPPRETRSGK